MVRVGWLLLRDVRQRVVTAQRPESAASRKKPQDLGPCTREDLGAPRNLFVHTITQRASNQSDKEMCVFQLK